MSGREGMGGNPNLDLGDTSTGGARFDASQYAFFGNTSMEGVELGGLDDDDHSISLEGIDNDYHFSSFEDGEMGEGVGSFSDIDGLAMSISQLNRDINDPRNARSSGPYSKEGKGC
ncbi:hypothetical protein ZOSMA_277G00180 [Zostera marina]|uniref:Uncharacterized protein n=1 Tax=Zostera marina TaxID=29655 RepID=A0A0K9PDX9_ZOSMR|nr:hypothetical protein ZOSMA_277G00180 [Zostera marina]